MNECAETQNFDGAQDIVVREIVTNALISPTNR